MYYFINRWTICAHVVSFINILRQKALKSRVLLLWKVWMYLCAMLKVMILNQKTISVKEAALSSSSWNATQDLWIGALVQPNPQAWPSAPLLREYLLCQVNVVVHRKKTISRKSTLLLWTSFSIYISRYWDKNLHCCYAQVCSCCRKNSRVHAVRGQKIISKESRPVPHVLSSGSAGSSRWCRHVKGWKWRESQRFAWKISSKNHNNQQEPDKCDKAWFKH